MPAERTKTRPRRGGARAVCMTALAAALLALAIGAAPAQAASAPTVGLGPSTPKPEGRVFLSGGVNPNGSAVSACGFQYGTEAGTYDQEAPCESLPGAGEKPVMVAAWIEGLEPGATYYYRLSATNALGTTASADQTFRAASEPVAESCSNAGAPGVGALAECRGWEMASPPEKNGAEVMASQARVRAAEDGSAVTFGALAGFGEVHGMGVAADYLSVRTGAPGTRGWASHGILPAQPAIPIVGAVNGWEPRYQQELSPDLSSGVVFAWRPLTDDPDVANAMNLYLRRDLRSPGPGSYRLITACPLCAGPLPTSSLTSLPQMLASTPDLGHVIFESALNLAAPAFGGKLKLYEWVEETGTVRLVGILPNGSAAADSAAGTGHGPYSHRNAISEDGRRIFFMADQPGGTTNVYMRLDGTTTVELNKSETGTETDGSATYKAASASGSRVFFTSDDVLTEDAKDHGGPQLYMYDTTKPDSDPHNLTYINVDTEPDASSNLVEGVVGASADGSTVYFAGTSQLVAGLPRPPDFAAMYAWHEGEISFVSFLPPQDLGDLEDGTQRKARVTASGDLVYLSTEPVGPAGHPHGTCPQTNTHACAQVYVYDVSTHSLICASCRPDGSGAEEGVSAETLISEGAGGAAAASHLSRIASDEGHVFFTTKDPLLPEDTNGAKDAYVFDADTATLSLLSSGHSSSDSYFMETTLSGNDAYFLTREQLVGWDRDRGYDLYDARVGGGFPEPVAVPAPCEGESCRAAAPPPPSAPPVGSTRSGPGNQVGPKRCRKGRRAVRRQGKRRCVRVGKSHSQKQKHSHRQGQRRRPGAEKGGPK